MPIRPCSAALCAVVLLCAQAAFVSATKQIADADVTLYGVHEAPFDYSLLEQEAAGIHAYHPARDGENLPGHPVAAFPFEAPALPTDFPIPREHFQTAPPAAVQRNPYDSSEYARNAAMLEQESQIRRGGLRMPYAAAGMAVPRPYLANAAGSVPMAQMQQMPMQMATPPMMMQQPVLYATAPQPQLTAVAVPIQVPVAAPVLVEQKATARQEPELDAVPAQSTVPMDSAAQQEQDLEEDIASATADPESEMPEARFAQQAPGSKSMSTDSASSLAASAQSQSAGAPVPIASSASAGSSSGSSSSSSGSSASAPRSRRRRLYKCNPAGDHCKVRFGNDVKWKMVTVPKLPDDGSSSSQSSQSGSQQGNPAVAAAVAAAGGNQIPEPQYSSNPEIARLQKAYYEKQLEIARETKWVANVRKIIAEYQEKVRNVARHALVNKQDLRRQEKDIQAAIRQERQAKLEVELRAALESLQKLESTSSALSSKVSDLTNTKLNLRRTISKIRSAMGGNIRANVQNAAASLLEVSGDNGAAHDQMLDEQQDASDNAKQLFSSLLQLLEHREKSNAHAEKQDHSHDSHHRSLAHRMLRGSSKAEPELEKMSEVDDLKLLETNSAAFEDRVHSIASKYADEERERLDADLPLATLALRDRREIDKDLDD